MSTLRRKAAMQNIWISEELRIMNNVLITALLFLISLLYGAYANNSFTGWESQDRLPSSFVANYEVKKSGLNVGKTTMSLTIDNTYGEYEVKTKATGFAKIFVGNTAKSEKTIFEIDNNYLKPNEYHSTVDKDAHVTTYKYDWENKIINVNEKGTSTKINLNNYRIDKFSLQLFLMQNPLKVNQEKEYLVVSNGEKSTHKYKNKGKYLIETKLGMQPTYLMERVRDNEKNTTYRSWHSNDLHNIPVKIEKLEYGKPVLTILIKDLKWTSE